MVCVIECAKSTRAKSESLKCNGKYDVWSLELTDVWVKVCSKIAYLLREK